MKMTGKFFQQRNNSFPTCNIATCDIMYNEINKNNTKYGNSPI